MGPKTSEGELATARIELIPFIRLADGGRVFDHNRRKGDFDSYSLGQAEWFSLGEEQACQPVVGTLYFQDDWQESVGGALHAQGWLSVLYALDRLPAVSRHAQRLPGLGHAGEREVPARRASCETVSVRDFVTNNGTPDQHRGRAPSPAEDPRRRHQRRALVPQLLGRRECPAMLGTRTTARTTTSTFCRR